MEVAEVTGSGGSGPIEVAISESTQESSVETTKDGKKISTMSASEYQMAQMADSKVSEKDDGTTKVKVAESVQAHQEQKQSSSVKVIEQQGDGEKKSKEKKVKRKEVIIEEGKDSEKDQVVIEDVLDDEDISDDESVEVVVVKKIIRKGSKKEKKEEKKPDPEPVRVEKEEPKIEESEEVVNKARKIEVKKLEEEEVPAESKAEVRHKKDGVTIVKQIERKVSIGNILEVDHKQEVRKVIAHQKEKEKEEEKKKEAEPEEEEEEQNEDEEEEENEDAEDEAEVSEEETVKPAKKEPEETETVKVVLPAKPKAEEEPKKPEEKKVESEPEEEVEEEEEEEESSLEEVSDVEKEPEPSKPVQPPPKEAVTTSGSEIKQENIKNQIKEIISDIDKEISMAEQVKDHIEMERITAKPEQEPPIQSFRQQQFENNKENISYTSNQVSNEGKVDLQKIFTPATDAQEILPARQRKLFSSSSFYTAGLHPTVEDQVELARRISHSLSDMSNKQSKGQTMYVNRKKRSVKWVHEGGEGKGLVKSRQDSTEQQNGNVTTSSMVSEKTTTFEESSSYSTTTKVPLKLVMDPRGQVQNIESLQRQYDLQPMSPDLCAEVVSALNESGGKGAELFAKRRKKSEKWVIDETNFNNNDNSLHQRSATTPSSHVANVPPAFTEFGQQRAQQNIKLNQIQEKYSQPRVKMVKSPWEAALETGYAQKAFEDPKVLEQQQNQHQQQFYQPPAPILTTAPAPIYEPVAPQQQQHYQPPAPQPQAQPKYVPQKPQQPKPVNLGRDLAYKPSVAQGWNAPPTNLPSEETRASFSGTNFYDYNTATTTASSSLATTTSSASLLTNKSSSCASGVASNQNATTTDARLVDEASLYRLNANYRHLTDRIQEQEEEEEHYEEQDERDDRDGDDNEQETYRKIPIKDLINSFESQSRPVMRYKLANEQIIKKVFHLNDVQQHSSTEEPPPEEEQHKPTIDEQPPSDREEMYVPPELPLSSYAPPPKMSDYISSAAGAAPSPYSSNSYSYAPISPAPQQQQQQPQQQHYQPEPTPNLGVQYMGSAKPRTPLLSPQIVENVSPTPYSQATSSGFNTVRELKKQFSHPSAAPMPQSYPPSQQKSFIPAPSANLGASSGQKVRNRSPAPFGRHASTTTTTNTQSNTQYQQTLTKTQFHNASYAAPTFKQHPPTSAFRPQPQQQQQQQQQYHPYHKTPQNQPQSAPAFGKPSPMSPSSVPNSVPTNFGPPAGSTTSKTIIRGPSGLAAGSVVTKIDRCKNYNTAPRGWNQASDVYKPVTFSGTQPIRKTVTTMTPQFANYNNAPYTDF